MPPDASAGPDGSLTLDEQASLTAGVDFWSTAAISRAGIRGLVLSDGPNGVRGTTFDERDPSLCAPSGSALAATWDRRLARELGMLIGDEARRKGVDVVLGPVLNIPRTPLGGRAFECLSEDPLLTAELGTCWIEGVQSRGVGACPKHFVANESETGRMQVNAVVEARALHEIYLLPFERALMAGAWGLMTAYNQVNGTYSAEHTELLTGVARTMWGWDGVAVSDWFGTHDTVRSALAGLDLEMPGPPRHFGPKLAAAVRSGTVGEDILAEKAGRLASLASRVSPANGRTRRALGHRELLQEAAAASFVLLTNDGLLPLPASGLRRVAIIGPNADMPAIQGGGSAYVAAEAAPSPLAALRAALDSAVEIVHEPGCDRGPFLPGIDQLAPRAVHAPEQPGITIELLGPGSTVLSREVRNASFFWIQDAPAEARSLRAAALLTPVSTGMHELGLRTSGPARLLVDETCILSTESTTQRVDDPVHGLFASPDTRAEVALQAGQTVVVELEMELGGLAGSMFELGCRAMHVTDPLERAVAAAASADAVLLVVGTNSALETEGVDRTSISLPAEQETLVRRVLAANRRTAVVINAGAAVDLGWSRHAAAVLYSWFAGQELGSALAAVLTGTREPGGRLPITLAASDDYPAYSTTPDAEGNLRYEEGIFVGYRGIDDDGATPYFCFGHGLSYTEFAYDALDVRLRSAAAVEVEVTVRNVGSRPGKDVVQLYLAADDPGHDRPPRELKAFACVTLEPGDTATVILELDRRSFANWDAQRQDWRVDAGPRRIEVGRSSRDIRLVTQIDVAGD